VNVYENIVILDASLSDEAIEEATQSIRDQITSNGGEVLKIDPWGRKKLAYEIKKHTRGFFILLLYKAPSDLVKKLETYYKVTDAVVKYMVVRLEKKQLKATLKSLVVEEAPAAEEK
jgi:small subunit ribosomal protein S6